MSCFTWPTLRPLLALGRAREALALLQKLDPGMFMQPEPRVTSAFAEDGIMAGAALIGAGAQAQGRDLIHRTLAANAHRPILRLTAGRGWTDVEGWALLGEPTRACATTRALGLRPSCWARSADIQRTAAAPSEI